MRRAVAALALLAACAPRTRFRNSALVPALTPPMTSGRPLEYPLRVELHAQDTGVVTDPITLVGDPALQVATVDAGGGVRLRLGDWLDVGARFDAAPYSSRVENTWGAAPIPGDTSAYGVGATVQASYQHPSGFGVAAWVAGTRYSVPYAKWQCVQMTAPCPAGITRADGASLPGYSLDGQGTTSITVPELAIIPSFHRGIVTGFVGIGGRGTITNVGFTNTDSDGSTVTSGATATLAWVGAELEAGRIHVLIELHNSLTGSPDHSTRGGGLQLSYDFGPERRPRAAPWLPPPSYGPPPGPPYLAPPPPLTSPVPAAPSPFDPQAPPPGVPPSPYAPR